MKSVNGVSISRHLRERSKTLNFLRTGGLLEIIFSFHVFSFQQPIIRYHWYMQFIFKISSFSSLFLNYLCRTTVLSFSFLVWWKDHYILEPNLSPNGMFKNINIMIYTLDPPHSAGYLLAKRYSATRARQSEMTLMQTGSMIWCHRSRSIAKER